jgi:hypothetical protein
LPSAIEAFAGGLAWAALMAASAAFDLWSRAWQTSPKIEAIALLFAVGGALGFPLGLFLARFLAPTGRREARIALSFLCLSIATIGATSATYILVYRSYYATWHADPFTMTWAFQWMFTAAGALAQFAAFGLRLYFPLGFAALLAASFWFGSKPR